MQKRGLPASEDEAATMRAGLLWLEPTLKRFVYRDLQESSELVPNDPLYFHAAYRFPWQGGDAIDEDKASEALPADTVRLEHALSLWRELRKRLGI